MSLTWVLNMHQEKKIDYGNFFFILRSKSGVELCPLDWPYCHSASMKGSYKNYVIMDMKGGGGVWPYGNSIT